MRISKLKLIPQRLYEETHPNMPWLSQRTVRYLDAHLDRTGVGFEWGSGKSTRYFAARLAHLTSVEHDQEWYKTVQTKLAGVRNVDLLCLSPDPPAASPYVQAIDTVADGSLAFVLIDGVNREACIAAAMPKMRAGGLFTVDNTDRVEYRSYVDRTIPPSWPIVHESRTARTQTTVWRVTHAG